MATSTPAERVPLSFWIVAGVSLIWNAFGATDYTMTRMRNAEWLAQAGDPQEILAWIDSFPMWAQIGWGLGVWGSVLGSVLLLLRSRHAVTAFAVSLFGAVVSFGYQYTIPAPASTDTAFFKVIPLVIVAAIVLQWWWARRKAADGTLR